MTNESETGRTSRPETIAIINCALNAPLMLIAIIANTLVLSAILRTPSLRSPPILYLKTSSRKYREWDDSREIFDFFIFCPNNLYSELFSKIPFKGPEALHFFRNRGKFENRHFSCLTPPKMAEIVHFLFARTDQRDDIYQYTLGSS